MNPTKQAHSMEYIWIFTRTHTVRYLKANKKRKRTQDKGMPGRQDYKFKVMIGTL